MEREQWQEFGVWLREQRERAGLSKRAAGRLAEITDATWRSYEMGGREIHGQWVEPGPRNEVLHRMARAVAVDAAEMFKRAGRSYDSTSGPPPEDRLLQAEALLSEAIETARGALETLRRAQGR